MADATAGAGGDPSSSSSSSSLDGGLLLRLLHNPPHPHPPTPSPPPAASPHFPDPAVAAVGPLFPSPPPQRALPHRFPAGRGIRSFGAADGIAGSSSGGGENPKPKPKAPPPGFGRPLPPPAASTRERLGPTQERYDCSIRRQFRIKPMSSELAQELDAIRDFDFSAAMGKVPLKDRKPQGSWHRPRAPPGRWVAAEERREGGKSKEADVSLGGGVEGGMGVGVRKLEVLHRKGEVRFAGNAGRAEEEWKEEDAVSERLMEAVVLGEDGDGKNGIERKGNSRGKDFRSDFSRGHNVSSQRIRIQRRYRGCRYDIDQFTPSFLSIFRSLVPSEEEIAKQKQLLMSLSKLINKEWPGSKLYLYGSCANSFGFSNSDIDLCLSINDNERSKADIILKLADILQAGNLQNVQALTRARVPIVKLMDPDTGLSCDICVNNLLAVVNTRLLKDYAQIDKRLRQLAFIVKHWAKSRRVNETYQGTLSSYAYVIMCIHLLQLRSILPCLQEMEATYFVTVENTECAYFDKVEMLNDYGARNEDSVARLLWAFFHYWAYQHDYTTDVISIRTGRIISKQAKDWTRRVGNDRHLICIEDPFETSHDLGRVVDKFSIKILREEFERAANILQYDPNPDVTLFDPYVPPPTPNLTLEGMVSNTETEL